MQTTGNLGLKKPEGTDIVDITDLNGNMDILDNTVNGKVDKVSGKQLSTNDYTATEKTKLTGIAAGANNYTHPNHTGDVTSTGDGVTAIAAGVIVDADVNAAAGIAWTKLNKAGASLADLAIRSAGDLTSGTLPAARLPAITGDITMAIGTGTAAITAGAVVNADVNAAAAIDATKIGTGVVSNAEFGYLDGVTSGIQAQLAARPLLTTTPQQTTAALTYYVRTDGNDANTGLANTAGGAFKTIAKVIGMIPQIVNHAVTINVATGAYAEVLVLPGFNGSGSLKITGVTGTSILNMLAKNNTIPITIEAITTTATTDVNFNLQSNSWVFLSGCTTISLAFSYIGVYVYGGVAIIANSIISNKLVGIQAGTGASVYSYSNSGTGNTTGQLAVEGASIGGSFTTTAGTSANNSTNTGGIINMGIGVINSWGDNTFTNRSAFYAFLSSTLTVTKNVQTKVIFQNEMYDVLGNYSNSTGIFTASKTGLYAVESSVVFSAPEANINHYLMIYKGGVYRELASFGISGTSLGDFQLSVSGTIFMNAGEYIAVYVQHNNSVDKNISSDAAYTRFKAVQIA